MSVGSGRTRQVRRGSNGNRGEVQGDKGREKGPEGLGWGEFASPHPFPFRSPSAPLKDFSPPSVFCEASGVCCAFTTPSPP